MSYNIYHSNNLFEFISTKSELFHSDSLFGERVITVIQNSNIAAWLKLELAKHDGISMDLEVEYPENAIKNLVLGYRVGRELFKYQSDDTKSLLFMDSFKIVVYKVLEELLVTREKFPQLFDYVDNSPQRLFQLSDSIAGLFYHYGMNCPMMVAAWDKKELYKNSDNVILREDEQRWQMELWNYIFTDTPYLHISKILNNIIESGEEYKSELSPYGKCRIILFGSSFLGESAIKFFNYLSRNLEVHHFILTPSEIYTLEEECEPHSLLNKFSGLINGFTTISRESDFIKERDCFFRDYNNSILGKLKQGIRDNSLKDEKVTPSIVIDNSDKSIRICKTTSQWREIEVLKDKILNLLDMDRGLKLTDIGVVAPDISDYSFYIEAIFKDQKVDDDGNIYSGVKELPYNIVGLKGGDDSPFIRGLLSILDLPGSDFNRKSIIDIISNPCVMEKFSITKNSRDLFINTIDKLNIKWGIDRDHRKRLGFDMDDFNTWEWGFKRYFLGIALNREDHPLIPYSLSDSQAVDSLGELVHIVRSLYNDIWSINSLNLNIDEWVIFIEIVMDTYLKPVKDDLLDERERLGVKHQFRNILNLFDDLKKLENFRKKDIPFSVFRSLLKEFIVKSSGSKGRYLTNGITFSSLKPLRAVPFKHIFVLGLNEDKFPGRESIPGYDIRGIYEQKIDLSKRQNDKYAFLELILSAESSLTMFFNSKNQITGEEFQPSVVISELIEAIELNFEIDGGIESLFEEHPLHSFDSRYFKNDDNIFSYDKSAYQAALAYNSIKRAPIGTVLDEDSLVHNSLEITVSDLIQFIKNPVKHFFTKGEGIYLDQDESIEEDIYENRELEFLVKWKFLNAVLDIGLKTDEPLTPVTDSFFKVAEIEGEYKDSLLTSNVREDLESIVIGVDTFLQEENLKNTDYKRETRELNGEYSPLLFNINGVEVTLSGELENLWVSDKNCFTASASFSGENKVSTRDKITPFIYSLIISAHKAMREESLVLYSIGRKTREPVVFRNIKEPDKVLGNIMELYIQNLTSPIPLYPTIMESLKKMDVESAWEKSMNDLYSQLSSDPYIKVAFGEKTPLFESEIVEKFNRTIYTWLIDGDNDNE